jgi:hypothetical protein
VLQVANGEVSNLWSDYGTSCNVTINSGDDCAATAAVISTGSETTFCTDDSTEDLVTVMMDSPGAGSNSAWVITSDALEILGLPAGPTFNFEGVPAGICLIWYVTYEDYFTGAEVGANAADLGGCFALSNSIGVTRLVGGDCPSAVNATSSLTSLSFIEEIKAVVYPNPNSGEQVFIEIQNLNEIDESVVIEVMDLFGKKVYSEQFTIYGSRMTQQLSLNSDLASGLYLVQIIANDKSAVQKLTIKQ